MFKEIQSGLSKFFGKKWIPIVVIIVICLVLLGYSSSKHSWSDGLAGMDNSAYNNAPAPSYVAPIAQEQETENYNLVEPEPEPESMSGYALQPVSDPSHLLPADANSQWAQLNPINNGSIQTPDLLQAGYHIGLDTIGQTLKNANLQLRSDPIITKSDVGPWNNSTYEADYGRVPLEIGAGTR